MMRTVILLAALLVIWVGGDAQIASQDLTDTDCLNIIQHLHGLQFDVDVALKQVNAYKLRLDDLVEVENGFESDLVEKSRSLDELRRQYRNDQSLAESTQKKLTDADSNITSLSSLVNVTSLELKSIVAALRNSTEDIDVLQSRMAENESTSRRLELSLQMLHNDIDTGNKTLKDAMTVMHDKERQVTELRIVTKTLSSSISKYNASLTETQSGHLVTIGALQKEKQYLADAREAHFVESHNFESLKQKISQIKMRIDNEKIDILARNKSILSHNNKTVSSLQSSLVAVEREIVNLTSEMVSRKTVNSSSHLQGNESPPENASTTYQPQLFDITPERLRKSIRESKLLLAREGYGDRFSLLQQMRPGTLGVDAYIHSIRDRSKLLSLEEELRMRTVDESRLRIDLDEAMLKSRQLMIQFKNASDTEVEDENLYRILSEKALNSSYTMATIADRIKETNARIAKMSLISSAQQDKIAKDGSLLSATRSQLSSTNATLSSSLSALRNAAMDVTNKKSQLNKMLKSRLQLKEAIKHLASENSGTLLKLEEAKRRSMMLEKGEASLSSNLESLRKSHTEALAEAAQLTRRLEEKSQHMQESDSLVKTGELGITQLETRISDLLNDRTDLQDKLLVESDKHRELEKRVSATKTHASNANCSI